MRFDSSEQESEDSTLDQEDSRENENLENDNNLANRNNRGYGNNLANGNNPVNHNSHCDNNREYMNNFELVFHPVRENNVGNEDVIDMLSDDENQVENGGLIGLVSGEILNRVELTHRNDDIMVITDYEREVGIDDEIIVESEVNMFENNVVMESEVVSALGPEDNTAGIGGVTNIDSEEENKIENDVMRTESDNVSGFEPEGKIKVENEGVSPDTNNVSNLRSSDEEIGEGEEATGEELDNDVDEGQAPQEHVPNCDNKIHVCDTCNASFDSKMKIKHHTQTVHATVPFYKCSVCLERFVTKKTREAHSLTHKQRFNCEVCLKSYKRAGSLRRHMKKPHNSMKTGYPCELCKKILCKESRYRSHVNKCGKPKMEHKCCICDEAFPSKNKLKTHLQSHVT